MIVGLAMADHRFDGGSPPQFAFYLTMDAALLPQFENPEWFRRVVAPVALVDIGPFDLAPGQGLGFLDHLPQAVAILRGRQPVELTVLRLKRTHLPLSWAGQRRRLGFES